MNKLEVYEYLKQNNIWYEVTEHGAVYTMEELSNVELPYPDADAKNLFVRDDKRLNYYLIITKGDKRVNLKDFRKKENTRPLTFASEEELKNIMKLIPGSVTPLGILNDEERIVKVYIDSAFKDGLIGVHPNDNTATVWLKTNDLTDVIKKHGNELELVEL